MLIFHRAQDLLISHQTDLSRTVNTKLTSPVKLKNKPSHLSAPQSPRAINPDALLANDQLLLLFCEI